MADAQHRLLLRRARHASADGGREVGLADRDRPVPVDGLVVPALLLLTARHLLAYDPVRVLGWRLLHDEALAARAAWLGPLLPRASGELDRDPIALALAAGAVGLGFVYLSAVLAGARPRARMALLVAAAVLLVALPTAAFVAMGLVTGRPYGQDGGVVQLPLAIDHILSGRSPYGADYAGSMLGRQARVSDFWAEHGGNPILRHHAYLPGTHLLMMPFVPLSRAVMGAFDPRVVTLLAFAAAGVLAFRLASDPARGLAAAAAVWVSPLVYWQQIFGANDVLVAALLLGAVHLARASRPAGAAILLGLACATKQLAWPFAPFLLAHLSGARSLGELVSVPARGRLARAAAIAAAVFALVVAPVAALDFRAFWADIVVYNAGLPGGDNYPLGGTPGLGLANLIVYSGGVTSLRDYVPLSGLYLALVPIGLWLLREQLRRGGATDVLVTGSAALLLSLYVSRVMHPNYLILAAVLLPAAVAGGAVLALDSLIGGLGLLATGVEIAEGEVFAPTWADAVAARWPAATGLMSVLAPRAGPSLTRDPLGLLFGALACGLGILLVVAGTLRARRGLRLAVLATSVTLLAIVPVSIVMKVGRLSGAPRLQDGWAAAVWPLRDGARPPLREAWSVSFRKDPPAALPVRAEAPALARLMGALGLRDPRVLTLLALIAAGVALARRAPPEMAMVRLAVLVLPPCLVGTVFGSGDVVLAALLAAGMLVNAGGRGARAGVALGTAVALFPRTVPVAALRLRGGGAWTAAMAAALVAFVLLGIAALIGADSAALPALGPGLGLSNLRLYAGAVPGTRDATGPALLAAVTVLALVVALRPPPGWLAALRPPTGSLAARREVRDPEALLAAAAALLMLALWLAPSASPDDVASPIVLLALAATVAPRERFDSPEAAL